MPVSILPIGGYFELDEKGFVINPASHSYISPMFTSLVNTVIQYYRNFYADKLHSVYLRGSLARGTFKEEVSDIDFIAIINDERVKWQPIPKMAAVNSNLKKSCSVHADFELMVSGYSNNLASDYPALAMVLKTQGLFLFGKNMIDNLPDYFPGQEMMIHYKWLEQDISDFLTKKGNQIRESKSIMKAIVRCGFELVMEREMRYTADLYPALVSFGKYYPEKKQYMEEILHFYLNPSDSIRRQKQLVFSFGNWLLEEIRKTLM